MLRRVQLHQQAATAFCQAGDYCSAAVEAEAALRIATALFSSYMPAAPSQQQAGQQDATAASGSSASSRQKDPAGFWQTAGSYISCLLQAGCLYDTAGCADDACRLLREACQMSAALGAEPLLALASAALAGVLRRQGNLQQADEMAGAAGAAAGNPGDCSSLGSVYAWSQAQVAQGDLYRSQQQWVQAVSTYTTAADALQQHLQPQNAAPGGSAGGSAALLWHLQELQAMLQVKLAKAHAGAGDASAALQSLAAAQQLAHHQQQRPASGHSSRSSKSTERAAPQQDDSCRFPLVQAAAVLLLHLLQAHGGAAGGSSFSIIGLQAGHCKLSLQQQFLSALDGGDDPAEEQATAGGSSKGRASKGKAAAASKASSRGSKKGASQPAAHKATSTLSDITNAPDASNAITGPESTCAAICRLLQALQQARAAPLLSRQICRQLAHLCMRQHWVQASALFLHLSQGQAVRQHQLMVVQGKLHGIRRKLAAAEAAAQAAGSAAGAADGAEDDAVPMDDEADAGSATEPVPEDGSSKRHGTGEPWEALASLLQLDSLTTQLAELAAAGQQQEQLQQHLEAAAGSWVEAMTQRLPEGTAVCTVSPGFGAKHDSLVVSRLEEGQLPLLAVLPARQQEQQEEAPGGCSSHPLARQLQELLTRSSESMKNSGELITQAQKAKWWKVGHTCTSCIHQEQPFAACRHAYVV